jgi:phosphomethylpyrimidine synthase
MNKPVTGADLVIPKVTTGPLPASRKVYARPDAAPDLRVPLREITLEASSGEPPLPVYDTTGPYTDPDAAIDVEKGLPRPRIAWVKERGGVEEYEGRPIRPSTTAMSPASIWRAISPIRRSRGGPWRASRSRNTSSPRPASSPRK